MKPAGQDRTLLVLKAPSPSPEQQRILVDTARHVMLKYEDVEKGKVASTTTYGDFVEVAGAWYAGRIEETAAERGRTEITTRKFTVLGAGQFDRQWKEKMAVRDRRNCSASRCRRWPRPSRPRPPPIPASRTRSSCCCTSKPRSSGTACSGTWRPPKNSPASPAWRWIRTALLQCGRRAEDAKRRYFEEAAALGAKIGTVPLADDDLFLAGYIIQNAQQILQTGELARLIDALRPVYQRQPPHRRAMEAWTEWRINPCSKPATPRPS